MYVIKNAITPLGITPASATMDTPSTKMDSPVMVCYKIMHLIETCAEWSPLSWKQCHLNVFET